MQPYKTTYLTLLCVILTCSVSFAQDFKIDINADEEASAKLQMYSVTVKVIDNSSKAKKNNADSFYGLTYNGKHKKYNNCEIELVKNKAKVVGKIYTYEYSFLIEGTGGNEEAIATIEWMTDRSGSPQSYSQKATVKIIDYEKQKKRLAQIEKQRQDSIKNVKILEEQKQRDSMRIVERKQINDTIAKCEKVEQIEWAKKIDDYIWLPQQLYNIRRSNPARYKTLLEGNRLLIKGKITHIVEDNEPITMFGITSYVTLYDIVIDNSIIIQTKSAKEASRFSIGDTVYALVKWTAKVKYAENTPIFNPVLDNNILQRNITDIVAGMKLQRKFDFDNPNKYMTLTQISWTREDYSKRSLIYVFNKFEYKNLYIQYLLKNTY